MKRLLLVDDDDDLRETFCDVLAYSGYDVTGAADGQTALGSLKAKGIPDLILLDLMMPTMSGAELKAALDRDPSLAGVPVVVLSGDARLAEQAAAIGAIGWIAKPIALDDLLAAIDTYLKGV